MFTSDILLQFLSNFDKEKQEMILNAYITSFEKHINIGSVARVAMDAKTLGDSVHDVKSLCYMLGANQTGKLAEQIENALKTPEHGDDVYDDTDRLLKDLAQILDIMREQS